MAKPLSTIVREITELPHDAAKVQALRSYDQNTELKMLLCMAYDKRMEFALPPGRPPFEAVAETTSYEQEDMLYNQLRKLYLFFKIPNPVFGEQQNHNLTGRKREQLFIQVLEVLPASDAELLLQAKERNIPGLPPHVVVAAFPGLQDWIIPHEVPGTPSLTKGLFNEVPTEPVKKVRTRKKKGE